MKKTFAFMCIILALVCFTGCTKDTGLDTVKFTEKMNDVDSYLNLQENDGKYTYSSNDVNYTVTCNDGGYITNILIECKNIPIRDVNTRSGFMEVLSQNYTQWTKSEYRVAMLFTRYSTILELFNGDFSSLTGSEVIDMIVFEKKNAYGNWEVYVCIESNQTNIIANYIK